MPQALEFETVSRPSVKLYSIKEYLGLVADRIAKHSYRCNELVDEIGTDVTDWDCLGYGNNRIAFRHNKNRWVLKIPLSVSGNLR